MTKKTNADKWLYLTKKKFLYLVVAWVAAVILHNAVSKLLGIEEAVFFTLAVPIIPLYFIVMLVYTIIVRSKR